jgi:hypothetical protein
LGADYIHQCESIINCFYHFYFGFQESIESETASMKKTLDEFGGKVSKVGLLFLLLMLIDKLIAIYINFNSCITYAIFFYILTGS